jgi:hypothetical protein
MENRCFVQKYVKNSRQPEQGFAVVLSEEIVISWHRG